MALRALLEEFSSQSMADLKHVLLDETPFVFLSRNDGDFKLKTELARFIEKCRKNNKDREYYAYSTKTVKKRLGFGWFYKIFNSVKTRDAHILELYQKRLRRKRMAKKVVVHFLPTVHLRVRPCSWLLKDLHLFANENKRASLKRMLRPEEVIPLDVCMNAIVAYRTGYPIFSFNTDYEYFLNLPHGKKSTIQYWKPEDILKNLSV